MLAIFTRDKTPFGFSQFLGYHTMTKAIGSLVFLFLFPLLLSNSEGHLKFDDGMVPGNCSSWCIAKYSANDTELINNILYACDVLDDCKLIQPGGSCFIPDTLLNHASVVMNEYYAKKGRNTWNCYFSDSGLISYSDPSYDSCKYA